MGKRIILCFDGTWNDEEDATNIFRTSSLVAKATADGQEQVVFYDRGVGTGFGQLLRGGLGGYGLSRNVRDGYEFLVRHYQEGDEVFLFGFSRGAFTARSLCGFLGATELLMPEQIGLVDEAYDYYRKKVYDRTRTSFASRLRSLSRRRFCARFLGVYDTVGSLGIPIPTFARLVGDRVDFHDTNLGDNVENAYHAMAIDERRACFEATYWTDAPGWARRADDSTVRQNIYQVWFPGVHADVGGGYKERGLADVALRWLLQRAEAHGLVIDWDTVSSTIAPDPLGPLHESMSGLWRAIHHLSWSLDPYDRPIGPIQRQERGEPWLVVNERIHESAFQRVESLSGNQRYAPPSLVQNGNIREDALAMPRFVDRKSPRHPAEEPALIGEAPCTVLDTSEHGARLRIDARMPVGSLVLLSTSGGNRPCRVTWRHGGQAGVAFEAA